LALHLEPYPQSLRLAGTPFVMSFVMSGVMSGVVAATG
jgi:hypothetical protein